MRTVRHWDACICRSCDGRGDSRHNFKWDSRTGDFLCFFCASAEHEGIATFQPNDMLSFACFVDQERVDVLLRPAFTRLFACINDFCFVPCPAERVRICQMIVNDDVSVLDAFLCAQSHETEIPWPCSN